MIENENDLNQKYSDIIDKTLTPENSKTRGLEYLKDICLDSGAPKEVMEDLFDDLDSGEFLLGETASLMLQKDLDWFGLYQKIND